MNPRISTFLCSAAGFALALAAAVPSAQAAVGKTPARPANAATNTASAEIPQSVFVIPATSKEGRDPFFPDSIRVYNSGPVKVKSPDAALTLVLNGLSGTPQHRLAMINGRTMEEGEEAEISSSSGRIQVHCIEIKTDSVIVEVNGERRELRLRGDL
jgi:hypothetical protein